MNIYEIAKAAKVSPATVSRFINGSPHISEEMKKRVQKTIDECGFVPNFFARGLNMKETRMVGILCPVIADLNHAKIVSLLEKYLRGQGFDVLLCDLEQNYEDKTKYLDLLLRKHVEAIFVIGLSSNLEEELMPFETVAKKIPLIIVNGKLGIPNAYSVVCNERDMAKSIVEQFCLNGCLRIAYLYDTLTYSGEQKRLGYLAGMEQCGLNAEGLIIQIPEEVSMSDIPKSIKMIAKFFNKMGTPPDAVLTADDILAIPAQKALADLDIGVPVVGWHNSLYAQLATPTLTSVDIDMERISRTAVAMLANILEGRKVPQNIELPARMVERESYFSEGK